MKDNLSGFSCVGMAVGFIALLAVNAVVTGFILVRLWDWFVVSLFALPQLTIAQAIGLSLIVGFLKTHELKDSEEINRKTAAEIFIMAFSRTIMEAVVYLTFGWVVYQFI
jgi:hypothetical protein